MYEENQTVDFLWGKIGNHILNGVIHCNVFSTSFFIDIVIPISFIMGVLCYVMCALIKV